MFADIDTALETVGGAGFPGVKTLLEYMVYKTAAATPTVNADFLGQRYFDSNASDWYTAVAVGSETPANDWKQDSA